MAAAKRSSRTSTKPDGKPEPEVSPRESAEASLAAAKAEIASAKAELEGFKREADTARSAQAVTEEPVQAPLPPHPPTLEPPQASAPMPTPEPAAAPSETFEPLPAEAAPAPTASVRRGWLWLSNLGWAMAAGGLLLVAYSYWWAVQNFPQNYNPGGVSGAYVGIALAVVGVAVGATFLFVPKQGLKASQEDPGRWPERAQRMRSALALGAILSRVGIGLLLLGLLAVALVYRSSVLAAPNGPGIAGMSYTSAATIGAAIAGVGLLLWVASALHTAARRPLVDVYHAATGVRIAPVPEAPAPPAAEIPRAASALGVSDDDVKALMRKVDTLLATLPEDVVTSFSKSPEADTYLKILGGEPKK